MKTEQCAENNIIKKVIFFYKSLYNHILVDNFGKCWKSKFSLLAGKTVTVFFLFLSFFLLVLYISQTLALAVELANENPKTLFIAKFARRGCIQPLS